jgi:hypothetical protein
MLSNRPKFPLNERDADAGMVISPDNRSMQRGRRRASRTEVCRPCLVWVPEAPEAPFEGVVLDLNPGVCESGCSRPLTRVLGLRCN